MWSNAVLVAPTVARWRVVALGALVALVARVVVVALPAPAAFVAFVVFVALAAFFAGAFAVLVVVGVAVFAVAFFAGVADVALAAVTARLGVTRGRGREAPPTAGTGLDDAGAAFLAGGRRFGLDRVVGRASSADISVLPPG